jgi:hypothetical protein
VIHDLVKFSHYVLMCLILSRYVFGSRISASTGLYVALLCCNQIYESTDCFVRRKFVCMLAFEFIVPFVRRKEKNNVVGGDGADI